MDMSSHIMEQLYHEKYFEQMCITRSFMKSKFITLNKAGEEGE
jgi:hypothetical protein